MINWIEFNGQDSRDFNLYVRTKQTFNRAKRDLSFVSVPGRSGDVIIDNGKYKNIEIEYGLTLDTPQHSIMTHNENFFYAWDDICKWLSADDTYYKLVDSYDPLYYRKACLIDGLEIEQPHYSIGKFNIKFNCKPYRYRLDGDTTLEIIQKGTTVLNTESHESLPYMKIYGSGDIYLHVGSGQYNFFNVSGYVEVDSEMMNVYKGLINKSDDYQASNYPTFQTGSNTISWSGNVTKIEIKPRWRTI